MQNTAPAACNERHDERNSATFVTSLCWVSSITSRPVSTLTEQLTHPDVGQCRGGEVHPERDSTRKLVESPERSGERNDFDLHTEPTLGGGSEGVSGVAAPTEPSERFVPDDRAALDVIDRLQARQRGHPPCSTTSNTAGSRALWS